MRSAKGEIGVADVDKCCTGKVGTVALSRRSLYMNQEKTGRTIEESTGLKRRSVANQGFEQIKPVDLHRPINWLQRRTSIKCLALLFSREATFGPIT